MDAERDRYQIGRGEGPQLKKGREERRDESTEPSQAWLSRFGLEKMASRDFVLNQIFVGYPWSRIRPMFEKKIRFLHVHNPLHFKAVGREPGQSASDLFGEIKREIGRSSAAIFDVTGGNPNVALEFGYAEALDLDIVLTVNRRKPPRRRRTEKESAAAIISDLGGKRVNEYRSQKVLGQILDKFTKRHPYVQRFDELRKNHLSSLGKRVLLFVIRMFDDRPTIRREEIVQKVLSTFPGTKKKPEGSRRSGYRWVDRVLDLLQEYGLISVSRGRYAAVSITSDNVSRD